MGNRIPRGKTEDLAMGATLRAATPYQWSRGGRQSGLVILPSDLQVKVRESRADADIVFAVDASDSIGATRRMKEVKEMVLSVLMDSYRERDQVELVAFWGGEAAIMLELARSVELAQREPQALPTSGRTPLAAELEETCRMLERQRRRVRDSLPLLVLIIGSWANFNRGGDPVEKALWATRWVAEAHIPVVVIDTERQFVSLGPAAQVAQVVGTFCYRVRKLQARPLTQLVHGHNPATG